MEWKLFDGDVPHVSTFAYHEHRERAPHAEQPHHKGRMQTALDFVSELVSQDGISVVDLGCGDGGFLQMVLDLWPEADVCGFDFAPANAAGWEERGLAGRCKILDVFPAPPGPVLHPDAEGAAFRADVTVLTEVLEHIARPHEVLREIKSRYVVASSPWDETKKRHDVSHAWAWSTAGYAQMFEDAGYDIRAHRQAGFSQVILAKRRG